MTLEFIIESKMFPQLHKCITVKLYNNTIVIHELVKLFKGSVQRKLRPMLIYIIQRLFERRSTGGKNSYFFKGTLHNLPKTPSAHLEQLPLTLNINAFKSRFAQLYAKQWTYC